MPNDAINTFSEQQEATPEQSQKDLAEQRGMVDAWMRAFRRFPSERNFHGLVDRIAGEREMWIAAATHNMNKDK